MGRKIAGQNRFDKSASQLEEGYPGNKYNQSRFETEAESFLSKAPKRSAADIKGTIEQVRLSDTSNRYNQSVEDLNKASMELESGYPGNKYNALKFENAANVANEVAPIYDAANANSLNVNKNALAELYKTMPEVKGQYGSAQINAIGGVALPIAVHYANQATHGEFNPLDIKSAGEGEDAKMQQINALNKQKYLESLSRDPSSEDSARQDWYNAMDTMTQEAYRTNPNLFRPTYIGNESGYSFASPQSTPADYNIIAPALQQVYGTPENYMIEGYKNLEQEARNPKDYAPAAIKTKKKSLLEQLYPKMKA